MKKTILYATALLLCLSGFTSGIFAAEQNKHLGASQLTAEETWESSTGKKLYFGQYNNDPMLFRVLKSNQDEILLDCDTVITNLPFNNDDRTDDLNNWSTSDLRNWLNGNNFYSKDSVFNTIERNLILTTNHPEETYDLLIHSTDWEATNFKDHASSEKIYLLSTKEAFSKYGNEENFLNKSDSNWWLRTAYRPLLNNYQLSSVGVNDYRGYGYGFELGVSPAFRIDPSSILFTTRLAENIYELTLLDSSMQLSVSGQITKHLQNGNTLLNVPYSYSDNNINQANRISLLITDKEYTETNASIQHYQNITSEVHENGILEFVLPVRLNSSDHVYLIAEKITDEGMTDYASLPIEISIPNSFTNILLSVQNPDGITVENGTQFEDLPLPDKTLITTELNPEGIQEEVTWDLYHLIGSYDPSKKEQQVFSVKGIISVPEDVTNPNGISNEVIIQVTVKSKEIIIQTSPETGDNQYIIISVILTIASAILLIGYLVYWKIKHR